MKKMLLTLLRYFSPNTGCTQQTFTVQNKPDSSSTKRNHHPSFLRFWNWAKKTVVQPKFVAAQKIIVNENPANIRKWIARFYNTLKSIYTPLEAHVLYNNCMSCPSCKATLSALLINILLGSFQLFLHSDQPLSEVK